MQLQKIKETYRFEENSIFKNEYLKTFAEAFLNSSQPSEYQLYHQYMFRSEIWENHIKNHYSYLLKDQEFSWDNPDIQHIIDDNSHIFVGYIKAKYKKKYSELFLSIKHMSPWRNDPKEFNKITGFCINLHDKRYDYMYANTIDFDYKHFIYPILFEEDIYKSIKIWTNRVKRSLQK